MTSFDKRHWPEYAIPSLTLVSEPYESFHVAGTDSVQQTRFFRDLKKLKIAKSSTDSAYSKFKDSCQCCHCMSCQIHTLQRGCGNWGESSCNTQNTRWHQRTNFTSLYYCVTLIKTIKFRTYGLQAIKNVLHYKKYLWQAVCLTIWWLTRYPESILLNSSFKNHSILRHDAHGATQVWPCVPLSTLSALNNMECRPILIKVVLLNVCRHAVLLIMFIAI